LTIIKYVSQQKVNYQTYVKTKVHLAHDKNEQTVLFVLVK